MLIECTGIGNAAQVLLSAIAQTAYDPCRNLGARRRDLGPVWPDTVTNAGNIIGGATRDRTADLLHAMQALSQLSYSPTTEAKVTA
jgi:hypothetical protein